MSVRTPPAKLDIENLKQIIRNSPDKAIRTKIDKNTLKKFAFATLDGTQTSGTGGPARTKVN
jgi:hypothetical protein